MKRAHSRAAGTGSHGQQTCKGSAREREEARMCPEDESQGVGTGNPRERYGLRHGHALRVVLSHTPALRHH